MKTLRRFSRWFDERPLVAVWLGFLFCFVLMYFVAPHLLAHHHGFTTT